MLTKRNWLFSFHCFFDPIWFVSIPSFFDPKTHPFKALRRQLRLLLLLCTIPSEIVFKLQKWFLIRVRVKRGGESKCTNKTSKTQNWYSQMSKTISSQVYLSKHDILGLVHNWRNAYSTFIPIDHLPPTPRFTLFSANAYLLSSQ